VVVGYGSIPRFNLNGKTEWQNAFFELKKKKSKKVVCM
jgi:hypothetical protein